MRIFFDVTPLLGARTGVARMVSGYLGAMDAADAAEYNVNVIPYVMSGRGFRDRKKIAHAVLRDETALHISTTRQTLPMPASVVAKCWRYADFPRFEWFFDRREVQTGDVVHGTNFVVPPSRSARQLVTIHDLSPFSHPEWCSPSSRQYPDLVRRALRRGAHVHVVSHATAAELRNWVDIDEDHMHVVYPSVQYDVPMCRQLGDQVPFDVSQPFLLAVGTLEPRKNYPFFISAFSQLTRTHPHLRLLIAGHQGEGTDAVVEAIMRERLDERVQLLGNVTEDQRVVLLKHAKAFVYPSLLEGFGFPPLEAMRYNVPVIASKTAAIQEVCGDAALFADCDDASALATQIERAVNDAALRESLQQKGAARVAQLASRDVSGALFDMYQKVVS